MMHVETLTVGMFGTNCFVAWTDPAQALVIDPGDEADTILGFLEREKIAVAAYLLTHGHVDHVSAVADLYDSRPAPIAIHIAEKEWAFEDVNEMPPFYPPPRKPARLDRDLLDGQEMTDGGMRCRVLSTPGHTRGSVCFFFPEEGALFSGDLLFAGSIGRTDLPGGDPAVMPVSLAAVAALPESTVVYPGHGPSTDIGQEKRTNPFLR